MARQAKVYSYMRFSTPEQVEGDSINRQTTAAERWAAREGLKLDTKTTMKDLGESAFRGQHREDPDRTALADFLDQVKKGKIERGSYLVIESLDRLTRESIRPALTLLLNLIEAGIRVVQLQPREMIYDEDADAFALLIAIMELSRGHAESAMKSWRVGQAWEKARDKARGGSVMFGRLPAWVRRTEAGELELIPERAAAIREMIRLALDGHGEREIILRLERSGFAAFGEGSQPRPGKKRAALSGKWQRAYVHRLLCDRRLLGECQPKLAGGQPVGPAIPNYFPPVVGADELTRVAAIKSKKRFFPHRDRKNVNVFAGMLRDETGSRMGLKSNRGRVRLISEDALDGRVEEVSFSYLVVESGLLQVIREVNLDELAGGRAGARESERLRAERDAAEGEVMAALAQAEGGTLTPMLAGLLKKKETRLAELQAALDAALQAESVPSAEAWRECQSLAGLLEQAEDKDEMRVKIRSALRRICRGGVMMIVPRVRERLCFVQLRFKEPDVTRFALLVYKQGSHARESRGWAKSRSDLPVDFDLARPECSAAMREELLRLDVSALVARLSAEDGFAAF